MLEALRKACTATLFGAGSLFAAADALLLVYSHTREMNKAQDAILANTGVVQQITCH